jgi:(p)ppGpp synthase/HD superfamily hydrolase
MESVDVRALARRAHAGQVDKAGRDYFDAHLTPIAEAAAVFGPAAEAAGWLHDILEDTDVEADGLVAQGVDVEVVAAVESVTRRADETYEQLIDRAAAHPLGRFVKLVDNAWNITSNPVLAALDAERAASMLRDRYLPARARLLAATGLSADSAEVLAMQSVLDRHHARLNPV